MRWLGSYRCRFLFGSARYTHGHISDAHNPPSRHLLSTRVNQRKGESLFSVCLFVSFHAVGRPAIACGSRATLFFQPPKTAVKGGRPPTRKTFHLTSAPSFIFPDRRQQPGQWKRKKLLLRLLFFSFGNCRIKSNEIQLTEKKETTAAANPSINGTFFHLNLTSHRFSFFFLMKNWAMMNDQLIFLFFIFILFKSDPVFIFFQDYFSFFKKMCRLSTFSFLFSPLFFYLFDQKIK